MPRRGGRLGGCPWRLGLASELRLRIAHGATAARERHPAEDAEQGAAHHHDAVAHEEAAHAAPLEQPDAREEGAKEGKSNARVRLQ